jgi:hypothetical protein
VPADSGRGFVRHVGCVLQSLRPGSNQSWHARAPWRTHLGDPPDEAVGGRIHANRPKLDRAVSGAAALALTAASLPRHRSRHVSALPVDRRYGEPDNNSERATAWLRSVRRSSHRLGPPRNRRFRASMSWHSRLRLSHGPRTLPYPSHSEPPGLDGASQTAELNE